MTKHHASLPRCWRLPRCARVVAGGLLLLLACAHADEHASSESDTVATATTARPPLATSMRANAIALEAPSLEALRAIATSSLSMGRLREHVATLASDAMEGRGAATRGIHAAADYIEETLRSIGLAPAFGPDGFRQPFDMTIGIHPGDGNALAQAGLRTLRMSRDFEPFSFSSNGTVEGPLVFAGFGIRAEKFGYDDYAGVDVKGKIVVVLSGEPGEDDPNSPFDGRRTTQHSSIRQKLLVAREAGAAAVLVVHDHVGKTARPASSQSDAGILAVAVTAANARRLLGFDPLKIKKTIDARSKPASRASSRPACRVTTMVVREKATVHNIAGMFTPPDAGPEVIVIGAHYDHLGYGGDDSLAGSDAPVVHNGADDNASGTAAVLEVARSLVEQPGHLRRSVIFAFFAGEESGLLGSTHFAKHPPVPIASVVAMVNLDMVGRLRNRRFHVMGVDSARELGGLAKAIVAHRGLDGTFGGDGYGPSDHTAFYSKGVPVLFLFTGAHSEYHKPDDDPETLAYGGLAEVGAVAGDLVRVLATAEQRPTYVAAPAPKPTGDRGGYGAYFGSIPDFGRETGGVEFAGVREGSPAAKAGAQKGDILVEFNGIAIQNLQDFTMVLQNAAPGDRVGFAVKRGEEILRFETTLEKRGEDRRK